MMKNGLTLKISEASRIDVVLLAAMLMVLACGTSTQPAVPYDLQFIDAMVAHHQAAVDMSLPADINAMRPELREFARKVVESQSREVEMMKGWRGQWYAGRPLTPTMMAMPGMTGSMRGMDSRHMLTLRGAEYDHMYLDMMVPHHEGAIVMAREALARAEHPEIKALAQAIVDAQQAEIAMMNRWKTDWSKAR
ncbi:DUF305 domain-containing protein [candidate division WOR-3 bacterium]|nr:DUF305 domain-containing protein [candidate division WOR-3 bacterium]